LELIVPVKEYEAWASAADCEDIPLAQWARQRINESLASIVDISVRPPKRNEPKPSDLNVLAWLAQDNATKNLLRDFVKVRGRDPISIEAWDHFLKSRKRGGE